MKPLDQKEQQMAVKKKTGRKKKSVVKKTTTKAKPAPTKTLGRGKKPCGNPICDNVLGVRTKKCDVCGYEFAMKTTKKKGGKRGRPAKTSTTAATAPTTLKATISAYELLRQTGGNAAKAKSLLDDVAKIIN